MIFSTLYHGEPVTGDRVYAPDVEYQDPPDGWTRKMQAIYELRKHDPSAPPTYSWWDTVPGDPAQKPTYYHFLRIWKRMTKDGTIAFLDCPGDQLIPQKSKNSPLKVSYFANDRLYLVLANHGKEDVQCSLKEDAQDCENGSMIHSEMEMTIKPLDLLLLILV